MLTGTPRHWRATRMPKLAGTRNEGGRSLMAEFTERGSNDTGLVALMVIRVQPLDIMN
jgi:hypothetical protein